jgi:hypothetical protein
MAIALAFFILLGFVTNGDSFSGLFFIDKTDSFMDHLNSVVYNEIDPYENKVIYPPLASLAYKLCNEIIPEDSYDPIVSDPTIKAQPRTIKTSQAFLFQFIMFSLLSLLLTLFSADTLKKGSKLEKYAFMFLFVLSAPFLFMAERGNNIAIPLALSMLFIAFYDSKNKFLREFALISLALAAGFKIYPIILGVLLLRNKQYAELIRAGIYCVITLILPFFIFYNGFESMKLMLTHIAGFSSSRSSASNINAQLDFKRTLYFLHGGFRKITGITIEEGMLDIYAELFKYLCTFVCVAGTFFLKERWKIVMLCAAIIYGFPGSCATYLLMFFVPAIILFLDEENKHTLFNFGYLALMTISQIPFTLPGSNGWSRYWPTKITSVAVFGIVFLVFIELAIRFIIWNYNRIQNGIGFFEGCRRRLLAFFPEKTAAKLSNGREATSNV